MISRPIALAASIAVLTATVAACGSVRMPGRDRVRPNDPAQASLGVNAYLWRASLDVLSFMPLASADPWGGTIITDWYANPEKPDEQFKVTVFILDTRLRADGVKVTVNKRVMGPGGQWTTAPTSEQTEIDMVNAILTKARQLRLANPGRG